MEQVPGWGWRLFLVLEGAQSWVVHQVGAGQGKQEVQEAHLHKRLFQ
jgi:hypothetical protein